MEYILRIPYNWKEYIITGVVLSAIQSILENSLTLSGKESNQGRPIVFFTPLNPSGGEEPRDDYTVLQKVHYHSHWKRDQYAVY